MREKEINETRRLLHLWSVGQVHSEKIVKRVAWHLDDADALESQLSEARAEVERLRAALEPYPMQHGPYIPTSIAKLVYRCYAAQYPGQSFGRIAERGGFGWEEVTILFRDLSRKQPALYKTIMSEARAALADDAGQMKETKCDKDFAGTLDIDGQVTVLRKRTP